MTRKSAKATIPLLPDVRYWFELPNGEFVLICLIENANGDWVVEHHDRTNEFIAGLQIDPECGRPTSAKIVASSISQAH